MPWHLLNPSFVSKEVAWMLLARLSAACFLSWISSRNPGKMSIVPMMKYPWKLIWHLKMDPCKRRFLLETITVRSHFHVSFVGCTSTEMVEFPVLVMWVHQNFWCTETSEILSQSRKKYWMKTNTQKKGLEMKVMGMEGYNPMPPGRKNRFPCKLLSTATITTIKELLKASFPGGDTLRLPLWSDEWSNNTQSNAWQHICIWNPKPQKIYFILDDANLKFRSLLPSTSEVKFMKLTFLWHRFLSNKVMLS